MNAVCSLCCAVFYISYSVENCNSVGTNVIIMGVSVVVCYFEKQQIENPFLLLSFFLSGPCNQDLKVRIWRVKPYGTGI